MIHNIDPVLFAIGPVQVRYYGLLYMLGFFIAYYFFRYISKNGISPGTLTKQKIEDYIFYLVIWTIVGSRLFEVIFYNASYFIQHPLEVFAIWNGGLSFHGGLLGVIIYSMVFAKRNGIPALVWIDFCAIPASIGLGFGRFANFINGELYGFPVADQTNPPFWSVMFKNTDPYHLYRYPTQLWESFSNFIVFFILIIVFFILIKKRPLPLQIGGLLSGIFGMSYALLRFIVEYWKDYEQNIFLGLSMGQLLCIPMFIAGLYMMIYYFQKTRKQI